MKRGIAWMGLGVLLGASLVVAPEVLGGPRKGKADSATAAAAVEQAAETAAHAAPLEVPTPVPAEAGRYDPSRSLAPLVDAVAPAVVAIEVQGAATPLDLSGVPEGLRPFFEGPGGVRRGEGSGFVVSSDGYVLTNHHVIDGAERISARLQDGTVAGARLVGSDPSIDVALLQLEGDRTWPHVELGTSADVDVGDWVVAVGNPLGLGTTVTAGIVSGKGRALGMGVYDDFLQTDAAINQGNSGGPLFDLEGRVIGINTMIIAGANTVGFAVPIDMAKDAMDDLRTKGHVARGYIGVMTTPDDEAGAVVGDVRDGTPAAEAGVKAGDRIVAVDGAPISDQAALVRAIGALDPGDTVSLQVVRGEKQMQIPVTLAERPSESAIATARSEPAPEIPGLVMRPASPKRTEALGVPAGVEVVSVAKSSPAHGVLEPGDVIVEVDHWPVRDPSQVTGLVARARGAALLQVHGKDGARYVALELD